MTDLHTQTAEQDPRSADELAADVTAEMIPVQPLTQTDGRAALSELVRRAAALEAAYSLEAELRLDCRETLERCDALAQAFITEKARAEAAEKKAQLTEQGFPSGIAWREHEGRWYLDLHRDGWEIELSVRDSRRPQDTPLVWINRAGEADHPFYDSEAAEARVTQLKAALRQIGAAEVLADGDFGHELRARQDIARAALAGDTETPT